VKLGVEGVEEVQNRFEKSSDLFLHTLLLVCSLCFSVFFIGLLSLAGFDLDLLLDSFSASPFPLLFCVAVKGTPAFCLLVLVRS
jgi:hypothetical protein